MKEKVNDWEPGITSFTNISMGNMNKTKWYEPLNLEQK